MDITVLKSKIHRARVTSVDIDYEGSIVIDRSLMEEVGLAPYEKVLVANIATGLRFETYVIEGEAGSGVIGLNGAAARLGQVGDRIIVLSFASIPAEKLGEHEPRIIQLDERNRIMRRSFAGS